MFKQYGLAVALVIQMVFERLAKERHLERNSENRSVRVDSMTLVFIRRYHHICNCNESGHNNTMVGSQQYMSVYSITCETIDNHFPVPTIIGSTIPLNGMYREKREMEYRSIAIV